MPQVALTDKSQKVQQMVSFLIITYNRKRDLVEVIEALFKQEYSSLEIIVIDNNSTDGTDKIFRGKYNLPQVKYFKMKENMGVSGGRNVAIEKAAGEILITIDDDAILENPKVTNRIVKKFEEDKEIGVLAFKIVNYFTGHLQKNAFPCRNKNRDPNKEFETTWFIGAGHAIKRKVYEKVGVYRNFRPWGSEEFDFALRTVNAGFKIIYFPEVTIRHKVSPAGRIKNIGRFKAIALKHRLKASILNLPWYSTLTMLIIRSAQTLLITRGNLGTLFLAYYWLIRELPLLIKERSPISKSAVQKLRSLKGPLYF